MLKKINGQELPHVIKYQWDGVCQFQYDSSFIIPPQFELKMLINDIINNVI